MKHLASCAVFAIGFSLAASAVEVTVDFSKNVGTLKRLNGIFKMKFLVAALSAFAAGADAVYCGLGDFSARAFAKNFSVDELSSLISYAHSPSRGWRRRVYVTFNTLIDEADIPAALESLSTLSQLQPDGVIVQDLGVASLCRKFFNYFI